MSNYDRELHEKLESFDARQVQHEKATRVGLGWLTILATAALALMAFHIVRL
jgi:hypothetical protein